MSVRQSFVTLVLLVGLIAGSPGAFGDTLILKNGERISGYYEGGTARVIRFRTDSGLGEYDLLTVESIRFGGDVVSSAPAITPPERSSEPVALEPPEAADLDREGAAEPDGAPVRLQRREEAGQLPVSENAADSVWTIPSGSILTVQMIDGIDTEENAIGEVFDATLAAPLEVEGVEVAPLGSTVRGRIAQVAGAGRVRGSAELRLELTQIVVNGVPYALTTAEYAEVAEGRGEQTARRVGTAAGIGAIIGAIAGGGQGAAIGAGVGAGAAGTVQVLTRGERIYIPPETLLGFTLQEPLVIARR